MIEPSGDEVEALQASTVHLSEYIDWELLAMDDEA